MHILLLQWRETAILIKKLGEEAKKRDGWIFAVADQGFSREGVPTPEVGYTHLLFDWQLFAENCIKMTR